MKIFSLIYRYLAAIALLAVTAGCTDDLPVPGQEEEGIPVSLKVSVSLPEMPTMSRSDMIEGLDTRVESLWVGVYNATSGKRTGYTTDTPADNIKEHETRQIKLDAESGSSYIVAVANYQGRQVIDSDGKTVDFATALDNADTWEKFIGISTMFNTDGDINPDVPVNAVLMSGHYLASHGNGDYSSVTPVSIPKSGVLPGAIHLRRLISQVKFNVGYNARNINDFEIISWAVYNIPNQTWVFEKADRAVPNVGDMRTVGTAKSYQNTQPTNLTTTVTAADGKKSWQFDWWQLENKRTGLDHVRTYADREVEFKSSDKTNSGLYASLLPSATAADRFNNNATFVELKVRLSMTVDSIGNTLPAGQVRIVDGTYTVHLGYCEGDDPDKSRDFNCRRNTKYTYNVTVNNVSDILVEAHSDHENAPGAEGVVSDVTAKFVELDAHYGVYNIYLSEQDLKTFEYMIRCYDGNSNPINIDSTDESTVSSADPKYLNWVEIRSTTSATVLSEYKPRTGEQSDGKTYTLDEFKSGIKNGTITAGHYTVFFNEYVYETADDGNEDKSTAWKEYVNKPDRQVWIRVEEAKSSDGESSHFKSKYAFSQRSIQTYYNVASSVTNDALGMEHVNESLGLNLCGLFNFGTSADNGRFNTAAYIAKATNKSWKESDWKDDSYLWTEYVTLTAPQTVNAINSQNITQPAFDENNPHPLPALTQLSNQPVNPYDPDQSATPKYIEAANACMNRNRDLNGNGKIDIDELRWYVPTVNIYIRMILGRRSLSTPIMNYDAHPSLSTSDNGKVTSLLIYGSNNGNGSNVLWCMEGTSTSGWMTYSNGAWNVRCVRNLGTDMAGLSSDGKVSPAYQRRSGSTDIIEMVHYDPASIRQEKITTIPPHDIANQDYNRCYKAFQYSGVQNFTNLSGYNTYNGDWARWLKEGNPCANLNNTTNGYGWRIPNQKEIAIMYSLGIYPSSYGYMPSATFSHYDNNGDALNDISDLNVSDYKIMCITSQPTATQQPYGTITGHPHVRCVRDVD